MKEFWKIFGPLFGFIIVLIVTLSILSGNDQRREEAKTDNLCQYFGGEMVKDTCIKSPFEVIELGDYR